MKSFIKVPSLVLFFMVLLEASAVAAYHPNVTTWRRGFAENEAWWEAEKSLKNAEYGNNPVVQKKVLQSLAHLKNFLFFCEDTYRHTVNTKRSIKNEKLFTFIKSIITALKFASEKDIHFKHYAEQHVRQEFDIDNQWPSIIKSSLACIKEHIAQLILKNYKRDKGSYLEDIYSLCCRIDLDKLIEDMKSAMVPPSAPKPKHRATTATVVGQQGRMRRFYCNNPGVPSGEERVFSFRSSSLVNSPQQSSLSTPLLDQLRLVNK